MAGGVEVRAKGRFRHRTGDGAAEGLRKAGGFSQSLRGEPMFFFPPTIDQFIKEETDARGIPDNLVLKKTTVYM